MVDVGGGTGALLAEKLRAPPEVHGTLVDLPRTIARSGEVFQLRV
ncbi:MAG: methyltransferase [Bryobacteraceae bacterium]